MIQFLSKKQIIEKIQELSRGVKRRILICSPYVYGDGYQVLHERCKKAQGISIRFIVTAEQKFSDPDTLQALSNLAIVRSNHTFHAKVYILDDVILVGSANLTEAAFTSNVEAMLCTDSNDVVESGVRFFEQLWKESESVTPEMIQAMRKQVSADPHRGAEDSGFSGSRFATITKWSKEKPLPERIFRAAWIRRNEVYPSGLKKEDFPAQILRKLLQNSYSKTVLIKKQQWAKDFFWLYTKEDFKDAHGNRRAIGKYLISAENSSLTISFVIEKGYPRNSVGPDTRKNEILGKNWIWHKLMYGLKKEELNSIISTMSIEAERTLFISIDRDAKERIALNIGDRLNTERCIDMIKEMPINEWIDFYFYFKFSPEEAEKITKREWHRYLMAFYPLYLYLHGEK